MTRVADEGAAVPGIWHLEIGNILLMAERRQKISAAARVAELEDLARLPITVDTENGSRAWRGNRPARSEVGAVTCASPPTLSDAREMELGIRLSIPLATFDAALRRAATAAGVVLL